MHDQRRNSDYHGPSIQPSTHRHEERVLVSMLDSSPPETSERQSMSRIEHSPKGTCCHDLNRAKNLPNAQVHLPKLQKGAWTGAKGKSKITEKGSGAANKMINLRRD